MLLRSLLTKFRWLPLLAVTVLTALAATPPDGGPTRLLRTPTVSATQIAFAYANNIWVVERAGGMARRLTSFQGQTSNPHFSPDGKLIAFSAEYAGNTDVYVVPAEGGEPRRLTWHPGADLVQGWTPDGKAILFVSSSARHGRRAARRASGRCRSAGGVEEPLALPRGYQGKISPDGTRIAYRMNNSWDEERRNYRGGQNRPIWIVDLKTYDLVSPPWTDSKDMDPVWVGDTVYFISDRDGVANVWAYDTKAKKLDAGDEVHRLRCQGDRRRRRRRGVRAGRLHPRTRSKAGQGARREHHRDRRLPVDDAEVGGRDQPHDQHGGVTHRQARGGRGARRDLHHPGREGRRPQPHQLERFGRARSGLVAGRQVRLVLQRQSPASTSLSSRPRTASRRPARSRCRTRRTTTRRRGRPTRRRSSTPTRT